LHLDFIRASEGEVEKVRRKAEMDEKRLKDAELQAALQRAAAAKSLHRRAWVLTAVAIAAVGAAIFGFWQKNEAEEVSVISCIRKTLPPQRSPGASFNA
jgi:hypothetical protein